MESNNLKLQQDVEAELRADPMLDASQIGVTAHDGVVTLSGEVCSYTQKYQAEDAPKRVRGVSAVANELVVRLTDDLKRTDADIAAAAVHALRLNSLVPDERITVTVEHGWVTLEGSVDYHYQRHLAENVVHDLAGVQCVSNAIGVIPLEKVAPTQVKQGIVEAFRRNAALDARRVGIDVHDGRVTLHGNVHSWGERREAVRAAWATPGVSDVDDKLTVSV